MTDFHTPQVPDHKKKRDYHIFQEHYGLHNDKAGDIAQTHDTEIWNLRKRIFICHNSSISFHFMSQLQPLHR